MSDATSEGLKGQTQTGKPNFTGDVDLTVPQPLKMEQLKKSFQVKELM